MAAALNGFLVRAIGVLPRLLLAAGGLLMMDPAPVTDLVGVVLLGAAALWQVLGAKKAKA